MNIELLPMIAGTLSTSMFMASYIPMLLRAFRTKDLHSYSAHYLLLGNLGNLVHWLYVANLPFGPIWVLHGFYTFASALMLFWYLRYRHCWNGERRVGV